MKQMKIGIVGIGVVGGAVLYGMEKLGHEVKVHDIRMDTSLGDLRDCEIVYVCVPTPEREDGSCDTGIVESVVEGLVKTHSYKGVIAIKSTVVPGTTHEISKRLGLSEAYGQRPTICFVPEFLRERHAISDFTENHDVCVIGSESAWGYHLIRESHGHYPQEFVRMTPTEAELSKYFSNVFNAMRVIFANGFYEVCKSLGADYTKIKNAVVKRPTMKNIYLDCNEKFRGYAGVCLPKDTAAFAKLAEDLGIDAQIFRTIVSDNDLYVPTIFEDMRMK